MIRRLSIFLFHQNCIFSNHISPIFKTITLVVLQYSTFASSENRTSVFVVWDLRMPPMFPHLKIETSSALEISWPIERLGLKRVMVWAPFYYREVAKSNIYKIL